MKVHHFDQRSPEWHEIRRGKITASEVGDWMAERPKVRLTIAEMKKVLQSVAGVEVPKAAKHDDLVALLPDPSKYAGLTQTSVSALGTLTAKKVAEIFGCEGPPRYEIDPDALPPLNRSQWAIWNGLRLEGEARAAYAQETDSIVTEVGFCEHDNGGFGCSPDGLITDDTGEFLHGLEIKCPLPETHIRYLMDGGLPAEYKAQVHASMAVTGLDRWDFWSYSAELPPLAITIERDDFTEAMLEGLIAATQTVTQYYGRIMAMENEKSAGTDASEKTL